MRTHYQNLKLSQNANAGDIRQAYRSLSQQFHPDKNHNSAESVRTFRLIQRAYEVLSDPTSRRRHDHWIRQGKWREQQQQHQSNSRQLQQQAIKAQQYHQVLQAGRIKVARRQLLELRRSQAKKTLIRCVCAISIAAGSSAIGSDSEHRPTPKYLPDSAKQTASPLHGADSLDTDISTSDNALLEPTSAASTVPDSQWLQDNIF